MRLSPVKLFHVPRHTEAKLYDRAGLLHRTTLFLGAGCSRPMLQKQVNQSSIQ
jgi:hypothetical protein